MTEEKNLSAIFTDLDSIYRGDYFLEALSGIEKELSLEDEGWIKLGAVAAGSVTDITRQNTVKRSRVYYNFDPLAKQAIRIWTDYTLGVGMSWRCEDEKVQEVLDKFWNSIDNRGCFSARGQRKTSDKLLVDGEVFFAIFQGTKRRISMRGMNSEKVSIIRRIDPLEITEIITDPQDIENELAYKREWSDTAGKVNTSIYRSWKNTSAKKGQKVEGTNYVINEDAFIYHLAINTIAQRGNPLLMPVLDWIKEHRRFLGARVAMMLALARFAWKSKNMGGAAAVATEKSQFHDEMPQAGSVRVENLGSDLSPIRTDSNARNAYDDARMLKLQIAAGVGISEQYFGDISTGNLATAKTVELPMLKQFGSYQAVLKDFILDIFGIVLRYNGIEKAEIDIDFPEIAPKDAQAAIKAILDAVVAFPEFASSKDVQQIALTNLGVEDVNRVLDELESKLGEVGKSHLLEAVRFYRKKLEETYRKQQEDKDAMREVQWQGDHRD